MKRSYQTADDVVSTLSLPVLAVVPVMLTSLERQRSRRRRLALVLGAVATAVAFGAAVAWVVLA
jgi:hypothetical protein